MSKFQKHVIALRHILIGKGYHRALQAMALGEQYHTGMRKDGVTPEFHHQVRIALYILTLPNVIDEEGTICTVFLHDIMEDYGLAQSELDQKFGIEVGVSTWRVTKKYRGMKKEPTAFFNEMATDCRSSLVKGADRLDNLQSMIGVFTLEKQEKYIEEAETLFLPMLKESSKNFPQQFMAYMNIRTRLKDQIALLKHSVELSKKLLQMGIQNDQA